MQFLKSKKQKTAAGFLGAAVLGISALAATNTVDDSNAGEGTSEVNGFTITAISYEAKSADVSGISSVGFTIVRAASETAVADANAKVYVSLDGTNWEDCTVTAGAATCDVSADSYTFEDLDALEVLAFDAASN
jgi:hypothetical protein